MFSKSELLQAIDELEKAPCTFQNAEKLATFYIIYDRLYVKPQFIKGVIPVREVTIDRYDGSDFYHAISGKKEESVLRVINDLMEALKIAQPQIYKDAIERLCSLR